MVIAQILTKRFELTCNCLHLFRPNRMQQSHVIPEIFCAFAPRVEIPRRGISLNGAIGAPTPTVGGFQSRAECLPALAFNVKTFERPQFAAQDSLDGARRSLVYEAPQFLGGTCSQR